MSDLSAVVKAGITVWTLQEYADAFRLCKKEEPIERCRETFALPVISGVLTK